MEFALGHGAQARPEAPAPETVVPDLAPAWLPPTTS
jgi:hypothetical protein